MFENLIAALKADKRKIVFTEGPDARILEAAARLKKWKSGEKKIIIHGMNVRTAKKNWILLYIFRIMKDTLRKIMQLPVRYVDG